MTRTLIGTLAGLGLAAVVATRFEGTLSTGVVGGYLFGAMLGVLGVSWQRHTLRTRPSELMRAIVGGFLFQLVGVLVSALTLRFVDAAAEVADWRSFLVAYAAAAFVASVTGSLDNAVTLREGRTEAVNGGSAL